jgi:hypothetical protein
METYDLIIYKGPKKSLEKHVEECIKFGTEEDESKLTYLDQLLLHDYRARDIIDGFIDQGVSEIEETDYESHLVDEYVVKQKEVELMDEDDEYLDVIPIFWKGNEGVENTNCYYNICYSDSCNEGGKKTNVWDGVIEVEEIVGEDEQDNITPNDNVEFKIEIVEPEDVPDV